MTADRDRLKRDLDKLMAGKEKLVLASDCKHFQDQAWRGWAEAEKWKLAYETELAKKNSTVFKSDSVAQVIRLASNNCFLEKENERLEE